MKVVMVEAFSGTNFDWPLGTEQEVKKGTGERLLKLGYAVDPRSPEAVAMIAKRAEQEAELAGGMHAHHDMPQRETR